MALDQIQSPAQVRPDEFVHIGPGTLAGRYLRSFWQPVALASDVAPGRARPLRILGEDYTLYRGEPTVPSPLVGEGEGGGYRPPASSLIAAGATPPPNLPPQGGEGQITAAPHLVAFRCAHRGTQLSTGWVEGDNLRCFYHGWTYGPDGQCVEQPAEPEPFCSRIKIRSYPVQEYVGLIFAYLGEGEPPPFPRYPQLEGEGVTETHAYVRECSYFNSVENNMDEAHIAFVHRSSTFTDSGLNAFLPEISGEETPYGIVRYGSRPNGSVRIVHLVMPNLLVFKGAPTSSGGAVERDQFAWRVPVDDLTHRSFNVSHADLSGAEAERYRAEMARRQGPPDGPSANELAWAVLRGELRVDDIPERPDIVNIQDVVAQVGQGQIPDREHEHLGRTDVMVALLRSIWLRELQALAEGRPTTPWATPRHLSAAFGI